MITLKALLMMLAMTQAGYAAAQVAMDLRLAFIRCLTASTRPDQVNTRSAVSGALSSTRNRASAAPIGQRLPCSQLRIVSCGQGGRIVGINIDARCAQ